MKIVSNLLCSFLLIAAALGQTAARPPAAGANLAPGNAPVSPIQADLDRLQAAASQANFQLQRIRIQKWKTSSESKQQSEANASSIERNLTSALPGLIDNVRSAPQDIGAEFKLYRNLNALYDVFASLTESAGAFGPRDDYEALAGQLGVIDSVRRNLGDHLEELTSATQTQLNQLRTEVQTLQQRVAAAVTPPKKVIVDDNEPSRKITHKKKPAAKTSASRNASSHSATNSGKAVNPSAPTTKPQ